MSTTTSQSGSTNVIETSRWRIDPSRSSVKFRSPGFWGLVTVKGQFARYDGTLDLRRQPAIELTIGADSLDTKNEKRDKHLRSADFFDVENHPEVSFVSDSATLEGERLQIHGQLSAGGHSIPLDLDATLRRVSDDELDVDAPIQIDHRELGMTHNTLGMIRTPSELIVHGRLTRDD